MALRRIRFTDGQWFIVPLENAGYALGLIARGSHKSVCLGYFFGPRLTNIPGDEAIWKLKPNPQDAVLITQFNRLGILDGTWPLIKSTYPFTKEDWPIPDFGMVIPGAEDKAYRRHYIYDDDGHWVLMRETIVGAKEIADIPKDSMWGHKIVEEVLTNLLKKN
jgi:hypothetical protein